MKTKDYVSVTMFLFLAIGLVHLYRAFNDISVKFGASEVPMWASWAAVVVAGYLAYSAYKLRS